MPLLSPQASPAPSGAVPIPNSRREKKGRGARREPQVWGTIKREVLVVTPQNYRPQSWKEPPVGLA